MAPLSQTARPAIATCGIHSCDVQSKRLPLYGVAHCIPTPVQRERLHQGCALRHSSSRPRARRPSRWQCSASDPQTPAPVTSEDAKPSLSEAASPPAPAPEPAVQRNPRGGSRRSAESTDWIASAVTRRFGIGAGLAWVGFLAFGVISEQLKTRREVYLEESQTRQVCSERHSLLALPLALAGAGTSTGSGTGGLPCIWKLQELKEASRSFTESVRINPAVLEHS